MSEIKVCACDERFPLEPKRGTHGGAPEQYAQSFGTFTVTGSKEVTVTWRDGSYFKDLFGSDSILASAGGSQMNLNIKYKESIDGDVIAHEYGHNLGYGHVDDSLMDPYNDFNHDGRGGEPLHEVSRDIFAQLDGVVVMDWDEMGISNLQKVSSEYARGNASISTLGYAAKKYASSSGSDAFYRTNFENFGPVETGNTPRGTFYRVGGFVSD